MYIVIRHINGEIDSNPFIVNDSNIELFKNGEYLIFDYDKVYFDTIEGCKVEVIKEIKD